MRRIGVLSLLLALPLAACGGSPAPGTVEVTVSTPQGEPKAERVPAWRLPEAGRVIAVAKTPAGVRVAQPGAVSEVEEDEGEAILLNPPEGQRIIALSRRGERAAVRSREGVRAGRTESFDFDATMLSGFEAAPILVFDAHPARIFDGFLWDLDVPRNVWRPYSYGAIASAVDPTQRFLALGDEEGVVTVRSAESGRRLRTLPRGSEAEIAPEIIALAIGSDGGVASLDRAGWVSCGLGSAAALPLAPPSMPGAVALADDGAWALRGGRAAFVACGGPGPALVCEILGPEADLRSAALTVADGRVYAAGLVRGAVVELPGCP